MPKKDMDDADEDYDDDDDDYDDKDEGWSFRKKFFTILIVIIVIIAAIAAVFLLNPNVQQVLVLPPNETDDGTGIRIEAEALLEGSGSANGNGELIILYEGQETYRSSIDFSGDTAIKVVRYDEFFYDRGEYEVLAKFGGKTSDSYFFDPGEDFSFGIVDHLNVSLSLEPDNFEMQSDPSLRNEPIYIHTLVYVRELKESGGVVVEQNPRAPPRNSEVIITITHESGEYESYTTTLIEEATATFDDFVYYSTSSDPGAGYYTVSAEITNLYVKTDSPMYNIKLDDITVQYLNIHPIAMLDEVDDEATNQNSVTIEFDASDSWNDGEILKYIWDFDIERDDKLNPIFEKDLETTSPKVSHTYNKDPTRIAYTETINVGVMVIGKAEDPSFGKDDQGKANNEKSNIDDIDVTIEWRLL